MTRKASHILGGDADTYFASKHWSNQDDVYQCVVCCKGTHDEADLDEDSCHPECRAEFIQDNPDTPIPKKPRHWPIFDEQQVHEPYNDE